MRKILIITGRYLPGHRDGGPVRSIENLTEWMGDEYDFRILCLDRDHGDADPYPGISTDGYDQVGKAKVRYVQSFSEDIIEKLSADADVVYVCGPYGDYARMAMGLKKKGKIAAPLFVASMGSFSPEAFRIKGLKKKLYIAYMKRSGMFSSVTWSVTSMREANELGDIVGRDSRCVIAADLPRKGTTEHTNIKEQGELKLVFLSRISRKKNLDAVPDILKLADENIHIKLDIYGTPEDKAYLQQCMAKLDKLKKTHPYCKWEYKGEADSTKVPQIFAAYDAFFFPTLGENYGHVIAESLSAGCVPVISDATPWLDLDEKGCGYVCSDTMAYVRAIEELAAMSEEELGNIQQKCYSYITAVNDRSVTGSGYRTIFG